MFETVCYVEDLTGLNPNPVNIQVVWSLQFDHRKRKLPFREREKERERKLEGNEQKNIPRFFLLPLLVIFIHSYSSSSSRTLCSGAPWTYRGGDRTDDSGSTAGADAGTGDALGEGVEANGDTERFSSARGGWVRTGRREVGTEEAGPGLDDMRSFSRYISISDAVLLCVAVVGEGATGLGLPDVE